MTSRVTIRSITERKGGEKLVAVTAYDALFARLADESGVDIILVGDSVGNVVAGFDTTIPVTLPQMIYHGAAARRGASRALLVIDLPFLTYQISAEQALRSCARVMQGTLAEAVKLEAGGAEPIRAIRAVTAVGIPVMGHLGFTPQSVHALGGPRVQGRTSADAERLVEEALRIQDAGAFAIVLELIPTDVAGRITDAVGIPTIGIGAGPRCDGQVLVLHDLLGLNDAFTPRFVKRYASLAKDVRSAIQRFGDEARRGTFPDDAHGF